MNKKKFLLILAVILYDISPIDLFPGPIDDAIVTILGFLWTRNMTRSVRVDTDTDTIDAQEVVIPANNVIKRVNKNSVHRSDGPRKI